MRVLTSLKDHGVECKARSRKRKAHSIDEGRRNDTGSDRSAQSPPTSRSGKGGGDASDIVSRRRLSSYASDSRPLQRSSSVSVPGLFVNRETGSWFPPDSSELIESPTQDRFRNASFLSRSAILGDDFQDIDHAHAEGLTDEDKISPTELKVLRLHGAFALPDLPLQQSVIEAYIERCYPWMPVIDLWDFIGTSQSRESSLLLLQAVILVGSLMRPDVCSKEFCDRQYMRVKALIQSGYEGNPLNVLAALCLVQWYTPTAPKDISTDVPRFWNTYAVGLAQQMGLHRAPTTQGADLGLRNRIWWTMVARDNLTASAHGRPRIIQPEDCTAPMTKVSDFGDQQDVRAAIFVHYVAITRILGDLCQLVTRKGEASSEDKHSIALRLHAYLESLPEAFRLYSGSGLAQRYSLELAQLHVPILITITILFRPRTVFQLAEGNAPSVAAAFLSFRVFQAIQLREHTRFLSSAFSWHLLVTAIPLLSCTKVAALETEANDALDALENVLETLGKVRPSAVNNLRNVRVIRKAMDSKPQGTTPGLGTPNYNGNLHYGSQLLQMYGHEAVHQYRQISDILRLHSNNQAVLKAHDAAHTLSCLSRPDASDLNNGHITPNTESHLPSAVIHEDIQNAFTAVFEDDTLSSSWMMRDWMDELQL